MLRYFRPFVLSLLGVTGMSGLVSTPGPHQSSAHQVVFVERTVLAPAPSAPDPVNSDGLTKALHLWQVTKWNDTIKWNNQIKWDYAVTHPPVVPPKHHSHSAPAPVFTGPPTSFGGLSSVVQCIKNHESGNYSESSHPGSGSGAYQFIPGTWRAWSARAGFPGYSYAYQAPPDVQDKVLMYTLTHGGQHNWDPAFGNDPCTTGL